jgi:type VI secretion system secreted protein VgrG
MRFLVILLLAAVSSIAATVNTVNLGTADAFAVLGGSGVTNTGMSVVFGNLGVSSGGVISGFPPGIVNGTTSPGDAVATQAQNDLTSAYNSAKGQSCGSTLTGQNLGGLTLTSGVYCFGSSAFLNGTLTLDAQGDTHAVFLFLIGNSLTTASSSSVVFKNGGYGENVFWQVGSTAALGANSTFAGNILAFDNINLNTGASLQCGRAFSQHGGVTMDTNDVSIDAGVCEGVALPEPGTATTLSLGLILGIIGSRRKSKKS